jgi:hypothetical protein
MNGDDMLQERCEQIIEIVLAALARPHKPGARRVFNRAEIAALNDKAFEIRAVQRAIAMRAAEATRKAERRRKGELEVDKLIASGRASEIFDNLLGVEGAGDHVLRRTDELAGPHA